MRGGHSSRHRPSPFRRPGVAKVLGVNGVVDTLDTNLCSAKDQEGASKGVRRASRGIVCGRGLQDSAGKIRLTPLRGRARLTDKAEVRGGLVRVHGRDTCARGSGA